MPRYRAHRQSIPLQWNGPDSLLGCSKRATEIPLQQESTCGNQRRCRARGIELNPERGRILFVLREAGPITSTLASTLDRLEAQGQLVRVRSGEDRLKTMVELTAVTESCRTSGRAKGLGVTNCV